MLKTAPFAILLIANIISKKGGTIVVVMGKQSFKRYVLAFDNVRTTAFFWPRRIVDNPHYFNDIIKTPENYLNWFMWIYLTAPWPKSDSDKEVKSALENMISEVLTVKGESDIIDAIHKAQTQKDYGEEE